MSRKKNQHFGEIDVERINVVESDGTLRMTLSNGARLPNPIIQGHAIKTNRATAGIIFFNDDGNECGGLVFGNKGFHFSMDAYNNDQVLYLSYQEDDKGTRQYGFYIVDRPGELSEEWAAEAAEVYQLEDGPEKDRRMKEVHEKLAAESGAFRRMYVGRNRDGESAIVLHDSKGRKRVEVKVDKNDVPRLEFFNENGEVTYKLPPEEGK